MPDVTGGAISGIGSVIGGGASLIGSLFGGSGGDSNDTALRAAQMQVDSANRSADLQMQMYREAVSRSAPWVRAGTSAVNEYAGLLNLPGYDAIDRTDYLRSTPGYQFQLGQGVEARDRSAASKGMLLSGPQLKAVTKYGQGLADTTYNSLMDRIYGLSGQGQDAAALTGKLGIATGQTMGNAYMLGGQAQGQGLYNAYNARESAYGTQQKNLMGGIGSLTRGAEKLAPLVSDWWSGGGYDKNLFTPAEADYYQMTNQYQ